MQFRIGTKISLLTCTMVLAGSWFLSELVMRFCARHVVDHEVVDLVDETNVSAQRMRRRADELREELTDLAEQLSGEVAQELYSAREPAADPRVPAPRIEREFNRLLKRQSDILQIEVRKWSPGQTAAEAIPVVSTRRTTVRDLSEPVGQTAFLDSVLAMRPHVAQLSQFTQAEVAYHRGPADSESDGGLGDTDIDICKGANSRYRSDVASVA